MPSSATRRHARTFYHQNTSRTYQYLHDEPLTVVNNAHNSIRSWWIHASEKGCLTRAMLQYYPIDRGYLQIRTPVQHFGCDLPWRISPISCTVGYIQSSITATAAYRFHCKDACEGIRCTETCADVLLSGWLTLFPMQHHGYLARRRIRWLCACRIAARTKMLRLLALMPDVALSSVELYWMSSADGITANGIRGVE